MLSPRADPGLALADLRLIRAMRPSPRPAAARPKILSDRFVAGSLRGAATDLSVAMVCSVHWRLGIVDLARPR
jgi:hypothetical protein